MDIIELENFHNVKFFPGGSYENESACRDFVNSSASLIFNEEVKEKLLKSNFISILCEGSTVSSVIEKEYIYVQFVGPSLMKMLLFYHCKIYLLRMQVVYMKLLKKPLLKLG